MAPAVALVDASDSLVSAQYTGSFFFSVGASTLVYTAESYYCSGPDRCSFGAVAYSPGSDTVSAAAAAADSSCRTVVVIYFAAAAAFYIPLSGIGLRRNSLEDVGGDRSF